MRRMTCMCIYGSIDDATSGCLLAIFEENNDTNQESLPSSLGLMYILPSTFAEIWASDSGRVLQLYSITKRAQQRCYCTFILHNDTEGTRREYLHTAVSPHSCRRSSRWIRLSYCHFRDGFCLHMHAWFRFAHQQSINLLRGLQL